MKGMTMKETIEEQAVVDDAACAECLTRPRVLERLGPYLENAVHNTHGKSIRHFLELDTEALVAAVGDRHANEILEEAQAEGGSKVLSECEAAGVWAVCRHNKDYPNALKVLKDPPAVLFGRGDYSRFFWLTVDECVSIVGSRRATSYGLEVSRSLGHEFAAEGRAVVSGLALGIDGSAHRGALEAGLTVAVLATGPDRAYPVSHTRLYRKIVEEGIVLSEMPPGARAWKWCFPARNRIIAALSATTIVVEAAARSGSMTAARYAEDLGRQVAAVPGLITSGNAAGTNELIAKGATLVRDASDVQ